MKLNLKIAEGAGRSQVISYDTLKSRCIDLVAAKGDDYVGHPGAYFRADGAPGCLLGELAAQDGATRSTLGMNNTAGVGGLVALGYLIPADAETERALHILQHMNDSGHTWFSAVCNAFRMTSVELREEIEARTKDPVSYDAEGYVEWLSGHAKEPTTKVVKLPICTKAAVPHVLAA